MHNDNILPFLHFKFFVNPTAKRIKYRRYFCSGKHTLKANRKKVSRYFELHCLCSVQIFCMPSAVRIIHVWKMYEKVFKTFGIICSPRFPLSVSKAYEVLIIFSSKDIWKGQILFKITIYSEAQLSNWTKLRLSLLQSCVIYTCILLSYGHLEYWLVFHPLCSVISTVSCTSRHCNSYNNLWRHWLKVLLNYMW